MFVIEDQRHCERSGKYASFEEAVAEIERRATIPWDQPPNDAPCMSWRTCGRLYVIIEYDDSQLPWSQLRRIPVMEISASGIKWESGFEIPTSGAGQTAAQELLRPSDENET